MARKKVKEPTEVTETPKEVKPPAPRSVAIVAMGSSRIDYLEEAVNKNGRWGVADETWAINAVAGVLQHDRAFIMDPYDTMPPQYLEIYKNVGGPIYTCKTNPALPRLVEYPIEDVINTLGSFPYFNSSVAYALGYALYLGVKTITLYGCDFAYPDVYKAESGRACVEAWIMWGMLRGFDMRLSKSTTLFDHSLGMPLYGFSETHTVNRLESGKIQLVKKEPKDESSQGQTHKTDDS